MTDEMTQVRSFIPAYAGHADASARRLADQQVRAWVGERLAALRERLPLDGVSAAFEDVLVHCQFGDQQVIKALEDDSFAAPDHVAVIEAEDTAVLAAAAEAERVDAGDVPAFITNLQTIFRHRSAAIVALKR